LSEVGDLSNKSDLKVQDSFQDISWRFQLIVVFPKLNEQLLLWKQSATPLDFEMVAKLVDKVAHLLIPLSGRIEVELDHMA
jgi:hypothetical protein